MGVFVTVVVLCCCVLRRFFQCKDFRLALRQAGRTSPATPVARAVSHLKPSLVGDPYRHVNCPCRGWWTQDRGGHSRIPARMRVAVGGRLRGRQPVACPDRTGPMQPSSRAIAGRREPARSQAGWPSHARAVKLRCVQPEELLSCPLGRLCAEASGCLGVPVLMGPRSRGGMCSTVARPGSPERTGGASMIHCRLP